MIKHSTKTVLRSRQVANKLNLIDLRSAQVQQCKPSMVKVQVASQKEIQVQAAGSAIRISMASNTAGHNYKMPGSSQPTRVQESELRGCGQSFRDGQENGAGTLSSSKDAFTGCTAFGKSSQFPSNMDLGGVQSAWAARNRAGVRIPPHTPIIGQMHLKASCICLLTLAINLVLLILLTAI